MEYTLPPIYDAILTFKKTRDGPKTVNIHIRYSKKKEQKRGRLPFPDDINDREWKWVAYGGEMVYVYHRRKKYEYVNMDHSIVPIELGQKLERLVLKVHSRDAIKD